MAKEKDTKLRVLEDPMEENRLDGRYETTYTALGMAYQVMCSRNGLTAKELAQKFNVSEKTAKRHMKSMKEIFPIQDCEPKDFPELKDRGRGTVYMATHCYEILLIEDETERQQQLREYKYKTDSNVFGFFQYLGVAFINDAMSGYKGTSLYTPFQMAIQKFVTELPEKTRRNFQRMRSMIVNKDKAPGNYLQDNPSKEPIITSLIECAFTQNRVVIEYSSVNSSKMSERTIEPYTWMNKEGHLYLNAVDVNDGNKMKTFKIDRIHKVTPTKHTFQKNIKLAEELNCSQRTGVFFGDKVRVVAIFTPKWETYLKETELVPDQKLRKLPDGSIEATWTVRGVENLQLDLRKFVGDVEVVEPASLRDAFIKDAQKLAEVYKVIENVASSTSNTSSTASLSNSRPTRTITKPSHQTGKSKTL